MIYCAYYFLLFVFFLLSNNKKNSKNNKTIVFLACILFLIVGLRHPSMGNDIGYSVSGGYWSSYSIIGKMSWQTIFQIKRYLNYEFGYILLNKILYFISPNPQLLLAVVAGLSIFPFFGLIKKNSDNPIFSVIVYLALPVFLITYSGLRQAVALGICCFAYKFLKSRNIIPFVLIIVLASLIHKSALIFLIAYIVYPIKVKREIRILSVLFLPIVYFGAPFLLSKLSVLFGRDVVISSNGAYLFLCLLALCYVLLTIYVKEKDEGWLNILFCACIIQTFAGFNTVVMRFGYYFLFSLPILIGNMSFNIQNRRNKVIINVVLSIFFVAYGLISIFSPSWAKAYPYHFFWEII